MKRIHALFAAALIGVSLAAGAHDGGAHKNAGPIRKEQTDWGIAGEAMAAKRTVGLTMSDHMRFTPDRIEVKQGETVKFVVRNKGGMLHEFVIGTKQTLDEHAALMLKFPDMAHDQPYMVHVKPGAARQVVWTFNRAGSFDFGCLVPGHYEAGMVGKINVAPAAMDEQARNPKPPVPSAQRISGSSAWKAVAAGGATAPATDMTDAEVRKIDKQNRKITLKHGAIKNLDMPPMTMVFLVRDAAMIDKFQPGDKVRFSATNDGGKLTVTEIQPVK